MKIREVLSIVMLLGGAKLYAQNSGGAPLWQKLMLDPQPNYFRVKAAFNEYWKDSVPTRGHGYKVYKRWEWRALQHMDADGNVVWPQGQLNDLLGLNQQQQQGLNSGANNQGLTTGGSLSACPASGRWNKVGPVKLPYNQTSQPTGVGRVAGIAFHPKDSNTIFACAPQGGLWKSTDNGKTWNMLFGNGPVVATIGTNSLLLSYNNPDTMYLGTGDRDAGDAPGYGVLASWNGGKTWVSRNSGMGNVTVGRMVMHPRNSAIMLVATNGGIYRTTNGGSSWTLTLSGAAWDVLYHPMNPSIAYAIIGAAFYRSTDGGASWTNITSGLPTTNINRAMIAVTPADRGYVYYLATTSGSTFRGVYRSTDSGSNFSTMSTTPNILGYSETGSDANGQGWYDLDLAADPKNAGTVYVAGINIWKSTNGGSSWTVMGHWVGSGGADDIHADQHALEFNTTGNKMYAGNDGGIYYSTDGGSRWNNITTGIQNSQIYRLAQAKTDAFAGTQGYQDNGSSQSQEDEFYTYYGGDGMDCQIDPTDHTYAYGSYVYGRIYRAISKNTIVTIGANGTNGINENGGWVTPFILREGNPSVMWAGYTNVWRCDNVKTTGAITWTKLSTGWTGSIRQLENSMVDNKLLFVIRGDGKLYKTTDGTVSSPTWTDLSGSQPSNVRYVETHPKNSNIVYACNASNLYKSTNQGTSWTSLGTLPSGSGNMNCLYVDTSAKTETVYIGSEKGVFLWDSSTASVIAFNNGFPIWADVTDMDIYYSPKGKGYHRMVVSTYGMGVWRSNLYDDGITKPRASFYAFDSVFVTGAKMRLYENIQYGVSSLKWRITPYSYSYVEGTDSLSNNPVIQFSGSGLYSVQLVASNCNGNDTLNKKFWVKVFSPAPSASCNNTTNWQSVNYAIGIMKINFADNKNETGGYFDDGDDLDESKRKIFRVKPSTAYTVTIKTGLYNAEYTRLFYDYNNNGKFENYLNEVSTLSASVLGSRNMSFTTPGSLKPNQAFRMRVLGDFSSIDTNACRNLTYGQGEDYTLVYERTTPLFKVSKTSTCAFENITFTDTSEGLIGLYEWSFGAGAVPSTATGKGPHTVYYSTTGTKNVRLRINGSDSLRKNSYVTVSVGPAPLVVVKSGSLSGCEGRSITLAARVTNGVSFTVQWQKNGVDISGKTDTLLALTGISPADVGNYRALLMNGSCTSTSSALAVQADPKPVVSFTINNTPQCFRYHKFNFTNGSTVSAGTISQNLWQLGDASTQSTTNASRTYAAAGTYQVKLISTSDKGCKDSVTKSATVYVNGTPKFTVNDSDQCVSGNNFVFTNNSSVSTGSLTYLWQYGDGNTSTTTSPVKNYGSSGNYTVRLISTTNNGCKDSVTKPIRVYSKPTVSFSLNTTAQCLKGNNFTTTNSSSNVDGSLVYNWNFSDGFTSNNTSPSHKFGAYGSYNLKLIATSTYGCKDSASQALTVHPQGNVTFTVNDSDQCLAGNNFAFTNNSNIVQGTLTYLWQFGDGSTSAVTSPGYTYSSRGIFTTLLIATGDKNCKDSLGKSIRVYSQPVPNFAINASGQCFKGNKFIFTNTASNVDGGMGYFWNYSTGSSTAQNITVSYGSAGSYGIKLVTTSTYGCKDSIVKNITVNPQATLQFAVNDSTQCLRGNNFVFNNTSSIASGSLGYNWSFGDNTSSSATSPSKFYLFPGVYSITLTSSSTAGCKDTATASVHVYANPVVDFMVNQSQQCFRNNQFNFINNTSLSTGQFNSEWYFGDGANAASKDAQHAYSIDGFFDVKLLAYSAFGCADSMVKTTTVFPQAGVAYVVNDSDQCANGNNFSFNNTTTLKTGNIDSYQWFFGDGNVASIRDVVHSYGSTGIYDIVLVVKSNNMCMDSLQRHVRVYANPVADFTTAEGLTSCFNYNHFTSNNTSTIAEGTATALWDNGDNSSAAGDLNEHSYQKYGNYTLKMVAVSNFGCTDSASKTVHVLPSPVAGFAVPKIMYCEGETLVLPNLSTVDEGTIKSIWNFGRDDISSSDTGMTSFGEFGVYDILLEVTSDQNCKDSTVGTVEIASVPKAAFSVAPPVGCAGQTRFEFVATSSNADKRAITNQWFYTQTDSTSGDKVTKVFDSAGIYVVRLNARSAYCAADSVFTMVVSPTVKAAFSFTYINKETVRFVALDSTIPGYMYQWVFGDGSIGYGQKATHNYVRNASFDPKLIVRNNKGCVDSSAFALPVKSPNNLEQDNPLNFYVYPNPNNGKFTYKFEVDKVRDVEVKIYDILGQDALYTKVWQQMEPGIYYEGIDLNALGFAPGTYPLRIVSGEDKLVVKIIFAR